MPEKKIHQPHDKLLRSTFEVPENASAFFEAHLPPHLPKRFEWDSLKVLPTSFITPQFAASECDLLFSVRFGKREARIYLLLEHQSSEDPRIAMRLYNYIGRIWERFAGENPPSVLLPPVFAMVLVQSGREWKTTNQLADLIDLPAGSTDALARWQPAFTFRLMELFKTPYEDFGGTPAGILALRALKAEPVDELMGEQVWDEAFMAGISEDALEPILRYVLNSQADPSVFLRKVNSIHAAPLRSHTMTLAEKLIEMGRTEGINQGLSQGLSQGFSQRFSQGLSQGQILALRQGILRILALRHGKVSGEITSAVGLIADEARLQQLLDHAILSTSLAQFAQAL